MKGGKGGRELGAALRRELLTHLPYTALALILSTLVIVALDMALYQAGERRWPHVQMSGLRTFEVFHLTHLFLSALTTSAVLLAHERNLRKAVALTLVAAPLLCTMSDIVIPYLGVRLLNQTIGIHICALEEPLWALGVLSAGMLTAVYFSRRFSHCSRVSHFGHIFVSTAATVLYIVSESHVALAAFLIPLALIVVSAVVVPCLVSDVVVPMVFARHSTCREMPA